MAEALENAGLWTIREYIPRRKATVADNVALWRIYEMGMGAERMPETSKLMWW